MVHVHPRVSACHGPPVLSPPRPPIFRYLLLVRLLLLLLFGAPVASLALLTNKRLLAPVEHHQCHRVRVDELLQLREAVQPPHLELLRATGGSVTPPAFQQVAGTRRTTQGDPR